MKSEWLHRRQKERLIIFCNGWGMDASPFLPLGAREYDVLMLFDYRDLALDCNLATLFDSYQSAFLVSWSMGVWVGQQIFQSWSHCLQGAIAINGTLCPIHDQFGIPEQLYDATLEQFNATARPTCAGIARSSISFSAISRSGPLLISVWSLRHCNVRSAARRPRMRSIHTS